MVASGFSTRSFGRVIRLLCVVTLGTTGVAKAAGPKFNDYPAEVYGGRVAKPILDTPDKQEFRTRLNGAAGMLPNFAGHFILATWGCGASCLAGAVINAKTGVVTFLPGTVCCWGDTSEPFYFRKDSRLIVFGGLVNEQEPQGPNYFVLDETEFKPIR